MSRNQTDPEAVGKYLLGRRRRAKKPTMAHFCNEIPWAELPAYDPAESTVALTKAQYIEELRASGDPEAQTRLEEIIARKG